MAARDRLRTTLPLPVATRDLAPRLTAQFLCPPGDPRKLSHHVMHPRDQLESDAVPGVHVLLMRSRYRRRFMVIKRCTPQGLPVCSNQSYQSYFVPQQLTPTEQLLAVNSTACLVDRAKDCTFA